MLHRAIGDRADRGLGRFALKLAGSRPIPPGMSLSSIASSGLRAASRAFEIAAQNVSSPSFSEVQAAESVRAVRAADTRASDARTFEDGLGYLGRPDLATEMVSMISAQRAFTASLTVLKAEDEMTSILVDMKR